MKRTFLLITTILIYLATFNSSANFWSGVATAQSGTSSGEGGQTKIYLPDILKYGPGLVPLIPQCIDCPKNISAMTGHSLRLDHNNYPHIAYGSDHLYHAWYDGSAWKYEVVDSSPGVGYYASLAFDGNGKAGISYLDSYNHTLKFARWNGSAWTIQTVDNPTSGSTYPSLVFDNANNPQVAYIADYGSVSSYQVKYARWTGSAWNVYPAVDTDTGASLSLALDQAGQPHISYFRNDYARTGGLMYASWTGSTWSLQIVDDVYYKGKDNSLAFDSQNRPHISYYDDWDGLKYASWNGSSWDLEMAWTGVTVDSYSQTSLTFGNGDMPMIAVSLGDDSPQLLWMVYKISGVFVHSQVGQGRWPSLASDPNGMPCISYLDSGQLRYAHLTALNANPALNTWTNVGLDDGAQVGQGVSMTVDRFGRPHIAYMDLSHGTLNYATQVFGAWRAQAVDIPGIQPAHGHSIAVDSTGNPHIAYDDYGSKKLMYASWTGTAWTVEVVGNDPAAGFDDIEKYISLALDAADNPHISFYHQSDNDLKHYYKVGSAWQAEEVDKGSGVSGVYNAIAVDSTGKIHISYQDNHTEKLMYAYWNGSSWSKTIADDTYTSGMNTSIAVDAANHPHICYSDIVGYYLMYAYYNGSTWSHETLTPASQGLPDSRQPVCSIKIGPGNVPYISFFDRISRHLTLAHKVGPSWQFDTLDANGDTGTHNSLALLNGVPFIAYYHTSNKDLMFVQWQP